MALKKAGTLYRTKKFEEAAEAVKEAQESLDALAGQESREVTTATTPLRKQLAKARDLLTAEGVKVSPGKSEQKTTGKDGVSFTKQVAPVLVAKCAGCHIQRSRGEFNMSTYVSLSKGSANGTVIMAGDAKGSRIVEMLESGDMPRGGGPKVSAAELGLITAWINAGAKFDGPDSAAPLSGFAPATKADEPEAKLKVVAATGDEEVQFARDIGPLLLEHCTDCHGEQNPRNQFSVATFSRLLQGGTSGVVLVPGKPEESLLVKKLRGLAGARMPMNQPALPEEAIAKIEKWVALGTRFDGPDPTMSLEDTVALSMARRATHDELSQSRAALAAKNWRLILPDAITNHEETANVLIYSTVGSEVLADVAHVADEQVAKLRKLFKVPDDQPFIKGRLTLFVFDKRYDYGEVGTMLEHREIPSVWRGHWRYTIVDAYGCLLLSDDRVSPGLVAQQIAGTYVASLGKIPHWFSEGTARAVAARFEPKDPRVKLWDDQVARIAYAQAKPDTFLTGDLAPEESDILGYSYVKFLMTSAPRYAALILALQQGTAFEGAFAKSFGASPSQATAPWASRIANRGR
jgi:mono/diheme cytochrome c family protein